MANMVCANCGASIEEGARFCRQCGRPIVYSEATTRELDPPQYFEPQTRPVNAADTSPTYSPMMGMPAHATQSMEGRGQKKAIIILSAVVAVLLVALLVVILVSRQSPLVTVQTPPDAPRGPIGIGPRRRPSRRPRPCSASRARPMRL